MPKLVNLKVAQLRKRGYDNVAEWLLDPKHLYIGRRMRIFIHTKCKSEEDIGTKVGRDIGGKKILIRPTESDKDFDEELLKYPVGSYVNKQHKIIHLCIIPQSKWYNPYKGNRNGIVDEFEQYLLNDKQLMNDLHELDNYTEIGCWCTPLKCHGDCILNQYDKLRNRTKKIGKNNPLKRKIIDLENDVDNDDGKRKKKRRIDDYFRRNANNKKKQKSDED